MQAGLEAMLVQVCWLSYGIMMATEPLLCQCVCIQIQEGSVCH